MPDLSDTSIIEKENLRQDWKYFKHYLEINNISYLYHFTNDENKASIKKHQNIYSRDYLIKNKIKFIPGSDTTSVELEEKKGLQNYIHLSIAAFQYIYFGKANISVIKVDPRIIYLKTTKFSCYNANDFKTKIGDSFSDFCRIKFEFCKSSKYFEKDSEGFKCHQAEVLVLRNIPIKFLYRVS